jgi:hypothetical protein
MNRESLAVARLLDRKTCSCADARKSCSLESKTICVRENKARRSHEHDGQEMRCESKGKGSCQMLLRFEMIEDDANAETMRCDTTEYDLACFLKNSKTTGERLGTRDQSGDSTGRAAKGIQESEADLNRREPRRGRKATTRVISGGD